MAKITKRVVDAVQPMKAQDVFTWDSELRGFGVRMKPSGVKTFLTQYRNVEGRTRLPSDMQCGPGCRSARSATGIWPKQKPAASLAAIGGRSASTLKMDGCG